MSGFIIVDDHPLARLAIRMILESAGHEVVAEAQSAEGLVELIRLHKAELVIMDIDLPGMDGIEAINHLREIGIIIPVIVMSGKNADYYTMQSMQAGASGFVSKKNNLEDLLVAVSAALSGYGYFPLRIQRNAGANIRTNDAGLLQKLSKREFEVLKYLGQGAEIINIAAKMKISNKTVSTYKSRIMDKLSLKNQKDLFDFTKRNNIN